MRHLLIIMAVLTWGTLAAAQTEEEDKGYLTSLIEENLSGAGRDVNIIGFAGALSSEATIAQMTIADAEGIWLTLEDVVLTWNRSALLRGAIDVEQIRAAQITVARPPVSEDTGPSPEAQPFSLPELPVSINLDALQIDQISLGEVFLGEPIDLSITGAASLADGEGTVNIVAERLGSKTGVFEIDGSYVNVTRALDILLRLEEGPDGIAANLIGLPGEPAVKLEITGDAPLDDFAATLALATAGEDRLTGDFTLRRQDSGSRATVDVRGDVSPLFEPAYRAFFGDDATLQAEVLTSADGTIAVPRLALDAGRLALNGQLRLGAGGWPELINIEGGVTALGDAPVLLPLTGPETFVDGVDLSIAYDVAVADDWRADITMAGFSRPGLTIGEVAITGGGLIRPPSAGGVPAFTARMNYAASGLRLDDAGAQQALGDTIQGVLVAERQGGDVTEITELTVDGAGLRLEASASIAGPESGFATDATIAAGIDGLSRFSTIAGRDIAGATEVDIRALVTPLDGSFDVTITGETLDLAVGIPEADRVLDGQGDITLRVVRDMDGTRLEDMTVRTDAAAIEASATLTSEGAAADFVARLNDLSLVVSDLSGPAEVSGSANQGAGGVLGFDVQGSLPDTTFTARGAMAPAEDTDDGQAISAILTADANDLSRFAGLAGMPLSGAVNLTANGTVQTGPMLFDVTFDGGSTDVQIGQDRVDPLIVGEGTFAGTINRTSAEDFGVTDLRLAFPAMSLSGDVDIDLTGSNTADLEFVLNDAAMLDPSLSGPIRASVIATPAPMDATQAMLTVTGPQTDLSADVTIAGPDAGREISGTVDADIAQLSAFADLLDRDIAGSVDLTVSGTVLPDLSRFDANINMRSEDLRAGIPAVDPLLAGTGRINASLGLQDGVLGVRTLEVSTREVSIVAALNGAQGFGQGRFNASLRDVGVLTDQISGPVRATGSASLDQAGNWGIDATGTGPGGLSADIEGQIGADGRLALDIDGSAPLALANAALDPRRLSGQANFDLAVNGPPAVSSLSGRITFADGRLAAPNLGQALTNIGGAVTIGNGRAQIDLRSDVETGGGLSISGPVALDAPNAADLAITLDSVVFRDPDLYQTAVDGRINVTGALRGGARIAGTLNLGQTDIQVPSSSVSSLGDLPDVTHIAPPADVRRTLRRAGLLGDTAESGAGGGGRPFPLDLTINAPSRIFIRGRGLDAELGGQLRITGTTANVIPVGRFSLIRGRIDILQQRFDLDEGVASLQGDFEPFIRLVATTESETGTVINIIVEGPAGSPEVRFVSVPELPQDEVLAQLIFGRDLENISPLQAVQLASAVSTLAGRGGGALDSFRSNLGLDDFDVTTDEDGNAAVRAGAYLSDNVYTDVTVNSEGETEINLNLDITREITAKGSVDQDGETSLGIFFERDY